nr:Wzt carbohydrate-binding domain-containing protein [Vitreimonas flagellata]
MLRDITLDVGRGASLAILGRNGAGKSTLLKLIAGTVRPTIGSVGVSGRVSAMLELGLGFSAELTGRQNLFQAGGMMGFPRREILRLLPGIEDFAEIGEYIDEPLRVYSSGMQARLAFALSTAVRPDVLIVDEVLSVGDPYFQAKCFERIASFREQGTTLLLVTHAVSDVVRHADVALLLDKGTQAFVGAPRDACNLYLDKLFGHGERDLKEVNVAPGSAAADRLSMGADVFDQRPGYRKEEHRWGNGGAKIVDYLITVDGEEFPSTLPSNANVDFSFSVLFERDFESVTPGILVKGLDGLFIYGTNSFLASRGQSAMRASAGERKVFRFRLPLDLNAGHYLVSFGVSSGPVENLAPLDRRYDSVMVAVDRPMGFWGVFDMRASFEVT